MIIYCKNNIILNNTTQIDNNVFESMICNIDKSKPLNVIANDIFNTLSETGLNIECEVINNDINIKINTQEYFIPHTAENPFECEDALADKLKSCPSYVALQNNIFAPYLMPLYLSNIINEFYIHHHKILAYRIKFENNNKHCILLIIPYVLKYINLYDMSNQLNNDDLNYINDKLPKENIINSLLRSVNFKNQSIQSSRTHATLLHYLKKYMEIMGYTGSIINFQKYMNSSILTPLTYIKLTVNTEQKLKTNKVYVIGTNEKINQMIYNYCISHSPIYKSLIDDLLYNTEYNCSYILYENDLRNNTRDIYIYLGFNTNKFAIKELNFVNFNVPNMWLFKIAAKHDILLNQPFNSENIQLFAEKITKLFGNQPNIQQTDESGLVVNIIKGPKPSLFEPIWKNMRNLANFSSKGIIVNMGSINFHTIYNKLHSIVFQPGIQISSSVYLAINPGMEYITLINYNTLLEFKFKCPINISTILWTSYLKLINVPQEEVRYFSSFVNPNISLSIAKNIGKNKFTFDADLNINENKNIMINEYLRYIKIELQKPNDSSLFFPTLKFTYDRTFLNKPNLNLTTQIPLQIHSMYGISIQPELFLYSQRLKHTICGSLIMYLSHQFTNDYLYGVDNSSSITCIGYTDTFQFINYDEETKDYYLTKYAIGLRVYSLNEILNSTQYLGMNIASIVYGGFLQAYIKQGLIGQNFQSKIQLLASIGFIIGLQLKGSLFYIAIFMNTHGLNIAIGLIRNIYITSISNKLVNNMSMFADNNL